MAVRTSIHWYGFEAVYTGKEKTVGGGKFFEVRIIEDGPYINQTKWTMRGPNGEEFH